MIYSLENSRLTTEGDDWWIAPNAIVIGNVVLKRNASIWWNSVVRADSDTITIGENSNVQDGSVLHADPGFPLTIGSHVTIGHMVMLHGCTIGDGTLVGIQAIVLNHAVIGESSLVAAGAIITERKTFPPRSLIMGAPAKVVRELTDEDVAMLERAAATYITRRGFYLTELTRID
jgi:carbonic anhydrase/acetyltransferase-like protein (isoleucine patch superfamily)